MPPAAAPFGATLAITVTLAVGCFLLLMAFVWVVHPPHRLPGYFAAGGDQNQKTKTALYVIAYAAILPLSLIAVPRLADAIAAGANARALPALAPLLAGSLALAVLLVRLSGALPWGDGTGVLLVLVGIWALGTALVLRRALQPRPWPALLLSPRALRLASAAAGALVFGLVLCVTDVGSLSLVPILLGAAALALAPALRAPRVPRAAGRALDVAALAAPLLVIPYLGIFTPVPEPPSLLNVTGVMQFHHDFLLGPANQVLHGGVLMANEPVSQWGVGSIYLLAGWFKIAPVGYGTYALLDGLLTSLLYMAAYGVLRLARTPRPLAIGTLALGVIVLVYNLQYPVGGLPQQGPLRFGLPMAVILVTLIGVRWPRRERQASILALAVLGISSVWALEGFAYTLFTLAAMACLRARLRSPGERLRRLAAEAGLALAAVVCAHLIFAGATLAASGRLPAWGQYFAFVHAFLLGGKAGGITYGFARWSPGVAVAAAYLASVAAIVLLALRRPDVAARERVALVALAGTTAYGIAAFSYFDNRSATYLLLYVALPALLSAALWVSVLLRSRAEVSRFARRGGVVFASCVAIVLLSAAWPSIGGRFARSPLAEAFPGGHGLGADMRRLWHLQPLDPRAPEGERLLARYMPARRRVLVLTSPDLGIEILIRSGRANELPLGDPIEESFVASSRLPVLRDAIARLRPGERMLTDRAIWSTLATMRAHPAADPLQEFATTLQAPLQAWVLRELDRRFQLVPIRSDPDGLMVVELHRRA